MSLTNMLQRLTDLVGEMEHLPMKDRIAFLNEARLLLHKQSPFKDHPVDCTLWVKDELVQANDYNPNTVADPEMELLEHSILSDGYTQPIVVWDEGGAFMVIDGFHRTRVGLESSSVRQSLHGYLPVVIANQGRTNKEDRMASTIRHNRARGKHRVTAMAEIVRSLAKRGWNDQKIAKELGMDRDEVLRFRQIGGLAEAFADREFSQAWTVESTEEDTESPL